MFSLQNNALKNSLSEKEVLIAKQKERITMLEESNRAERNRVKGLAHLVVPLQNYSTALESILQQKVSETNKYLQSAATTTISYNYNHLFNESIFDQLLIQINQKKAKQTGHTLAQRLSTINITPTTVVTAQQIAMAWLSSASIQAGELVESSSGQSLDFYLPPHQPFEALTDLRNGVNLMRAAIGIIYDRVRYRNQAEAGIVKINPSYYQLWPKQSLHLEDLERLQSLVSHSLDLLTFLVGICTTYLDFPAFKAVELFSQYLDLRATAMEEQISKLA